MLNSTFQDVYWTFILPLICLFSLATNTINIIVFKKISSKSRNTIYKYMLVNSISDQVYLICVAFIFIVRCGQFCTIKDTYLAKFYVHYIYMYAANSIAVFSMFLEISIVLHRFASLKNKNYFNNSNIKWLFLVLFIFCFIFHIPQLSTFEIRETNQTLNSTFGSRVYVRENVTRYKNFIIRNLLAFQSFLRLFLIIAMIVLISRLTRFIFKKYEAIQLNTLNAVSTSSRSPSDQTGSFERGNKIYLIKFFY